MLRTNVDRSQEMPIYREVLRDALQAAWQHKHFWPLAFVASMLFSAGGYDVFLHAANFSSMQSFAIAANQSRFSNLGMGIVNAWTQSGNTLGVLFGIQVVLFVALLMIVVMAFACVCQGALVFALGVAKRGEEPKIALALKVGASAFWPVAALNAMSISVIWILRFFAVLPMALLLTSNPTREAWILDLVSFIVFFGLQFVIMIVQGFALNAIVLQGTAPAEAIRRAYDLFKRHWVVAVETTAILAVIAALIVITFFGLVFVLGIPLVIAIIASALVNSASLYYGAVAVFTVALVFLAVCSLSFLVQMQYATWTYLYRRLGEGGAVPKLHRIYRLLTGSYPIHR